VQKVIDYMKMDVEGGEWTVFESMFKTGILSSVKQFGFETHTPAAPSARTFFEQWKTLKQLESLGFRRWYWHFNHYGTYLYNGQARSRYYELVYINVNFMSKQPTVDKSYGNKTIG